MPGAPVAATLATEAAPAPQQSAQSAGTSGRFTELQVTAHMMTLDTGLYCIVQTAGGPASDPITGLPGVRVTAPPGIAGRPEAVSVSTFRDDGWLNGTAALVRVTDGSAQVLVTIYQDKGADAPPRLQVLRLSGEETASAPANAHTNAHTNPPARAPQTAQPAAPPPSAAPVDSPEILAHIQRSGDVGCKIGDWLGQRGSRAWIEGFGIAPASGIAAEDIEYQGVLGRNWLSPWVEGGKFCGSRGMALPLLGMKIRLKGAAAKTHDLQYSATFVDGSTIGPVNAGETCEAESLAALEAFQVVVAPRADKAPIKAAPHATAKEAFAKLAVKQAPAAPVRPAVKPGPAAPVKPAVKPVPAAPAKAAAKSTPKPRARS